ncbi:phage protease [Antrihabitans sp. YC2-6]|uniref:phage protease n=1 Tax=Antrihabitans sp. YC2-6 TaxID=2799498 RepID=UPI0018F45B0B|nr:phage protease [Antrihabitans sp. YC2-6]MBJ8343949.1 hypothetical protein [Antrihabitans sp. YC2-6]
MAHKAVQRIIAIKADADGNPPESIHLLSAGHWHTPWHGAFEHTTSDLAQMVVNFGQGIGLVKQKNGAYEAPINKGHDTTGPAAGWITGLRLENNGAELWGDVRWTKEGSRALREEEYKFISPEWNPRDFPWEDPENEGVFVDNVLSGAGLTNTPLFKKLQPVMASQDAGGSDKQIKEGGDMDLAALRAKNAEDLTDDEKAFLAEHKSDLTEDELKKFGLTEDVESKSKEEEESNGNNKPDLTKEASAKIHGLSAAQVKQLQADAKAGREAQQELLKTKLTASVESHISRGAIKQDQTGDVVDLLMASSESQREKILKVLDGLPENKAITAGEKGTGRESEDDVKITDEEKSLAEAFGNTAEDIEKFKKAEASK